MTNKFRLPLWLSCLIASGCSVINFSANYYEPPSNYQLEVSEIWGKLKQQLPLKYDYDVRIIAGRDSNRLNGIPAISNKTVLLPNDFVKYIYQNYYDDRAKILTGVMVHEMCHVEYKLPSKPAGKHSQTDIAAIKLLGDNRTTANYYYKSLYVMKNYWFARKGVAGHTLNAGWNAINGVSYALGGPAWFADFFATDLTQRMDLIAKHYKILSTNCFERSGK